MSWLQGAGEAEEVAAAALVAGVLSGADQVSYLLDLQIALYLTNYNCSMPWSLLGGIVARFGHSVDFSGLFPGSNRPRC